MKKTPKILLIGGGTGGHIYPLRNLVTHLISQGAEVELIVNDAPLDKRIVQDNFFDIPVHPFKSGKIRRYLSLQNISDLFRIIRSLWKAHQMLKEINPDILFFKGGFVSFPFLVAARYGRFFKGKIYAHESDISPGVITRLSQRWADQTFESFHPTHPQPLFFVPEKLPAFPQHKKPFLLFFGGSQGAHFINELFEKNKDVLLKKYKILLLTGEGKNVPYQHPDLEQFPFLPAQILSEKIHQADVIVSRAGANSLFEIVSAKKPSIIIPLPSVARDHQRLNAEFFAQKGLCHILPQDEKAPQKLPALIEKVLKDETLKKNLQKSHIQNSAQEIAKTLLKNYHKPKIQVAIEK